MDYNKIIDEYIDMETWEVRDNANIDYSLQGLNLRIVGKASKDYWLKKVYTERIKNAHLLGDFHLHNLPMLATYCVGWDIVDVLWDGFGGISKSISSKPPKHFVTALDQAMNFLYTLQNESAGAQAFSNFDSFIAPFIKVDKLSEKEVKQALQGFLFKMNTRTRIGLQSPFTNLTFDLVPQKFEQYSNAIIGGEISNIAFEDCTEEMETFNKAYNELMYDGDAGGRIFPFPIITYNLTKDFRWDQEDLFKLVSKYGSPYFSNYISTGLNPMDSRSMCCRYSIDLRELRKRQRGGYFSSHSKTGSVGVVTLNLPRLGYLSKDENDYFERLDNLIQLAANSLIIKRAFLETGISKKPSLYPYSEKYLRDVKERTGQYWFNHFSTIGIVGLNESCINLLKQDIIEAEDFADKVLKYIKDRIEKISDDLNSLFNFEATPAETTAYDLAIIDKQKYPEIKVANEEFLKEGHDPYYTNSSNIPVFYKLPLAEMLRHQTRLQEHYTGGCVFHVWMGEQRPDWIATSKLVRRIAENYKIKYFTLTPSFSLCPKHGYFAGEDEICPTCGSDMEVMSRITGYFGEVSNWNPGKRSEFKERFHPLSDNRTR